MNIRHTKMPLQSNAAPRSPKNEGAPQNAPEAQAQEPQERVNWSDVKAVGGDALTGAAIGGMPLIGAGLGLFEISSTATFGGDKTGYIRGGAGMLCNLAGTASLATGYTPGAVVGLGGSALIGAGAFVYDNLHGKTLFTTEPPEAKEAKTKPEFSAGLLAKSVGAGAMAGAFGAVPGLGLLLAVNAADYSGTNGERPGIPTAVGLTTMARVGGAVASLVTGSPVPYMAGVVANSAALAIDNAMLNYHGG